MSPSAPDQSPSDLSDQIEQLQEQISRAQQTIRQIQNVTGTGVGSTTPARTKGGITIPPVSGLKASVTGNTAGETNLSVTWIDAPSPTGATIDHYDVYVINAFGSQNQPTLVGGSKQSPFVGVYQPGAASATTVAVQTVLSNGQRLRLSDCPTTGIVGVSPKKSVLRSLLGLLPQAPVTFSINSAVVGSSTVLLASAGNGGSLMTITIADGGYVAFSSGLYLQIALDNSATVYVLKSAASANMLTNWTEFSIPSAVNHELREFGVGFQTSCQVTLIGSGASASGNLTVYADYAIQY